MECNTHTSNQDVWEIFANHKVFREEYLCTYLFAKSAELK